MRKKFLLMIFVLSLFTSMGGGWLHAQTKNGVSSTSAETITLFEDDFTSLDEEFWTQIDHDGDGKKWYLENGYIISKSYYSKAIDPEDYIATTSSYTLSESSELTLKIGPNSTGYNVNAYKVVISEDMDSWTIVYEENFGNENLTSIQTRSIPLRDYSGRTVHVGVLHYYGDPSWGSGIKIDYIKLTGAAPAAPEASFEGEGTEASPYLINNLEDLATLRDEVNGGEAFAGKYFKLTSNITLSGEWTAIGNGSRNGTGYTGNAFNGVFDGGDKTISGLTITSTTGAKAAIGLFGVVDGGTVKNLNLTDVNINVASSDLAGAAIGMMLKGATADNITVSGAIVGHDGVGGIVGRLIIDGTIANCTNNASVTSSYGGIGGIVGKPYYDDASNTSIFATIEDCINNGTITAPMYVGGIAGLARANVVDCVNNGEINGGTQTGGIIGQLMAAGTVSGNENKAKVSGKNHLGGIIGDYSQSSDYHYYNVTIANNINRGELAATEQCAAIMGCNNIDGFTAMTATGNLSYYFVEGLQLFGNPEDMVIDATNKFVLPVVAKIGTEEFTSFADALNAAKSMTGDVTVEICAKVTMNQALTGSYTSIKFVGPKTRNNADAEIYLDVQGYTTATGKKVAFENLKLSKSQGGYITNAGFMNVAFGIYDVAEVSYTNCTFLNGACASFGKVTYTDCTFYRSWDKYGLWTYGNVDVTVEDCTFADYRGIKMYVEGGATSVEKPNLVVKSTDFSAVSDKPAIVLTYGESVELEGNTYSSKGVFELDLDGAPNGVAVKSDVAPTCTNDNGKCGVLVDGKIYTTVAQAAEVATSGSTVTLLHDSTEEVEFPMGTTINKNGFTADNVTTTQPFADYVVLPSSMNENNYKTLFGTNTVTDGTNYYATLQLATEAVAGTANAVLYCKPNANVGSLQHAPVTSTLTVYGNNANVINGGERDFDLGNTDPNGGRDITADMTLTVKRLNGCGAWGAKATAHTVNLVFENCYNMGKVFISGTTGTLNITMTDCAFEGVLPEAIYSNADGAISLNNVAFSNLNKAVNLNHKAAGTQTVTINGCSFTNCGADVTKDEIPVRVLTSVAGGNTVLAVSNTTFSGTIAGGADILLPNDKGITDARIQTTAANVKEGTAEMKNITASDVYEYSNAVAQIGTAKYASIQKAVEAAVLMSGDVTIEILAGTYAEDINLTNAVVTVGNVKSRPNITFKPVAGADVTLAGTTTLGYRIQNVDASMWNGEVTFEGIKFNHAESLKHSLDIQDVKGITLLNCTVTGDGEYGIGSNGSNATPKAAFTGCTFENGAMQVLGLLSANLVIDDCEFTNFSVNAQGGTTPGLTIKNSTFDITLTDAHIGQSFYVVRSNANPINIQNTKFAVDSKVSSVAADQSKWGIFWARQDANAKWNIDACEVNLTDAAMAQTELLLTKNAATTYDKAKERIVITNLTSTSNDVAELAKRTEGCATINNVKYLNGELDLTGMVAKIGDTPYATLAQALTAATDGATVNLLWKEGDAAIAMNGSVFGKNVTITGTAKVDWSKGNLFVGRGGEGNATVTFDGANLTSASNSASYGIHVSGREKNTNNKYDGTLVIKNSTIVLDYLINRGEIKLDEGAVLTVKNGFGIAGRPASETENGADATATITLENNAKLVVNNHNGMGLGQAAATLEGYGVMNVNSGSTFETTQDFRVSAKGTMNIAGTAKVVGTLTNNGAINLTAEKASLKAQAGLTVNSTVDGCDVIYADGAYTTKLGLKGKGTENEPYLINTLKELEAFRNSVNEGETKYNAPGVYVALNADIDLAGTTWEHGIGDGINATFDGIFDGRNNTIKNFTMEVSAAAGDYVCGGLFGYIYGAATIKNLVIENATITATVNGEGQGHNVGVLVGFAYNKGGKANISGITVKGDVKVDAPNVYGVGSIVGYSYYDMGTIDNCKVLANEGSYIKGYSFVGGITGYSYSNAVISNCSVENLAITATSYSVGGIAGVVNNNNKIENCTVAETVTVNGQANVGSVVGAIGGDGSTLTIENCTAAEPMIGGNYGNNKAVVAKIGEKYYTLEGAVNAVQNGETITLIKDVTENVTLTEKTGLYYTIDGAGKTMNGTITVKSLSDTNDNRRITIKNINFVDTANGRDFITSTETNHYPRLTVESCSFTGTGKEAANTVAIRLKSSHSVVIKDCTGTGLHSFLQNTSGWNLTIENVTVTNSKSALALGTVQGVTVKGSNIDVTGYGIRLDAQTYNNNAVIESNKVNAFIPVVVRKADAESNITFKGTNEFEATNTDGIWMAVGTSEYETNGQLPTDATGKVTVALNDNGLDAMGVYGDYVALAGAGKETEPYLINTLKELEAFRASVNKGETKYNTPGVYVALNADIDLAGTTWERGIGDGINATFDGIFDGRNKTIKNLTMNPTPDSDGYVCGGLFGYIYGAATIKNLVIENATITATVNGEGQGHNVGVLVGFAYNKGGKANISNITVTGDVKVDAPNVYGVGSIVGYSYYDMGTIDNCKVLANEGSYIKGKRYVGGITGYSYDNAVITKCIVNNLALTGEIGVGGIAGLAKNGNNIAECTVTNVTVNGDKNVAYIVGELQGEGGSVIIADNNNAPQPWVGGSWGSGEPFVATIGTKYYTSIKDAIKAVKDNETIVLIRDITMDYNARDSYETQAQNIVIDGNDHTLTLNQKNSDWASIGLANNSKLVLNNMTIEKTGYGDTNGAWNTHAIIFSCPLEMNDVIVNNAIAVQAGAILNNVAINEAGEYYGLWINGNGQTVTVNGGAINATNKGRGIKIADQYIDAPAQVTLNVTGTDFNTAKKAAVLVSSKAGAQIVASNVDITDVVADNVNFVWVDEDWAANYGNVEVTGAKVAQEGIEGFVAAITKGANVEGYYKTLQAAVNAVQNGEGETITLINDVAENVTVSQNNGINIVIDGQNHNFSGTITIDGNSRTTGESLTIQNIEFVTEAASHYFIDANSTSSADRYPHNVTVQNCTFTAVENTAAVNTAVAMRFRQGFNINVNDVETLRLHSLMQNYGVTGVTVENVTVEGKNGIALGTSTNVTVNNANIVATGYGLRVDASVVTPITIKDSEIEAFIPVVVRYASADASLTFNGTNTFSATNTDGYWCVIGTSEYEENGQLPTAATGNVFVSLNDEALNYEGIYGHYAVAQIGDVKYTTLQAAVNAVKDGGTITLIADEVFTKNNRYNNGGYWDGLGYSGDKSFTIDLAGYTIKQDGNLNDYLIWIKNDGDKANTITLKNGTLDAGTTAYCAFATASSNSNKITINTSNINFVGNNSSGAVLKIRGGAELNANAGTIITGNNNYVGIEVVGTNTVVNINEGVEIYQNGTSSYVGSLAGVSYGATLNVIGGKGTSAQGGFIAMTSGGTINVSGGEWIANTDGTYVNGNKSVLIAQSDKQYNAGAGNSIINVTGGTFKGGYNCYGNAVGDAQINISGGNFNANPKTYVIDKYEVVEEANGTFTVKMSSFEKFYTAAGVETTTGGVYSLAFEPTSETEVSVKIGSKNPAENKNYDLIIPSSVEFDGKTFAVTSIPVEGFKGCKGFDKLVVPGTITSVSDNAFYNCSRLTEIVIEEGVQKLGKESFYKISDLKSLTLPSTLTRIESLCFRSTEAIETIICNAQTPPTAFDGSFTATVYKNALVYVAGEYEDYKAANGWKNFNNIIAAGATQTIVKTNYTLIATITDVWNRTCSIEIGTAPTNNRRAQLEIPEHVSFSSIEFDITSIPESGFQDCKYFEGTLTIPAYITSIGSNAFNGCSGITELVVEEGVTSLGTNGTFEGCRNIETIILPSTLETIPSRCFHNIQQNLQTIVCNAMTPPTLGSNFTDAVNKGVTLYVHDVDAYKAAIRWKEIKDIRLIGAVAQNMTTSREYKSLEEAINEAAGATVKVLDNVVLEEAITVAAGAEVTLDLNGKVVSYESAVVGEDMITNNGKLTVESSVAGGKITYNNTDETGANVTINTISTVPGSELIINGGIIENTSLANNTSKVLVPYAIDILTNGGLGDVAVTINGGEIVSTNYFAIRQFVNGNVCNNSLTVKGGTITGLKRAINVQDGQGNGQVKNCAKLLVEAGDIIAGEGGYAICNFANSENVALTGGNFVGTVYSAIEGIISGGTFSEEPYSGYLADGFICEPNADGTYSVIEEPIYTQTIQLNAGWNWFSSYVETDLESLQTALGTSGVQIKGKDSFTDYYNEYDVWYGGLTSIAANESMYIINMANDAEITLEGKMVDPETISIEINQYWNWIAYPLNVPMDVNVALANLDAKAGDQIKSKDAFADYYEGYGWYGSLVTLEPGLGYVYYSASEETTTFTYSTSTRRSEAKANVTTDGNYWIPNAAQFANNMTMTAVLDVENINYEVAAFVNGECRGSARPIYVEALDAYMLFLTIHGEEVEEMTFKYYDIDTDTEYTLSDRINYSNNAILGSLKEPYMFTRGTTGIGEAELSQLNIYPNPTTTAAEINLNATFDKVEVFNALGVKVAEYSNVDSIDALETAGIYVIRATNNSVISHCRLVVK